MQALRSDIHRAFARAKPTRPPPTITISWSSGSGACSSNVLLAVLVDCDLVDCHRDLDVQLVAVEHVHRQDEGQGLA